MTPRSRNKNGTFRKRTRGSTERDYEAYRLKLTGIPNYKIAEQLGVSPQAIAGMVERAAMAHHSPDFDTQRSMQLAKYDRAEQALWEIVDHPPHLYTVRGMLIRNPDGSPAVDTDRVATAVRGIRDIGVERARILGLNAPSKQVVLTMDLIDHEIAVLEERILQAREQAIDPPPSLRAIPGSVEQPEPASEPDD